MIDSYDMSSAYPAAILQKKYPITRLVSDARSESELVEIGKPFLSHLIFKNLQINTLSTIPYLPSAKCLRLKNPRYDNGRILSADLVETVVTDIDYQIITSQYIFDSIERISCFSSTYGYLPDEFRKYVFDSYIKKCNLKGGDKYYYDKEKNKINANFGMMLTDIVHDNILYNPYDSEKPFEVEKADLVQSLDDWYSGHSVFLAYQWGLWVTAHCRLRLQKAIDMLEDDIIYCDTDSVKFFGEHNDIFIKLNAEILHDTELCGFDTEYTRPDGQHFSLGLWERDEGTPYRQFVTLGSKKYAYIDCDGELHITVAGLSKAKGAAYLKKHGGLSAFKIGTVVPPKESGRTTAHYNDVSEPYYLTIDGKKVLTGSSIAVENVPYTFGITDDYSELLEQISKPIR